MLEHTAPTLPDPTPAPSQPRFIEDEPMTEDYGDPAEDRRALNGGVDFFSSLGTERKKKQPDRPDPEKVRSSSIFLKPLISNYIYFQYSFRLAPEN